ncbi:MAG TPA: Crp/Fnr family transcriptional regulator [Puia sp.]|uniref:Crp/Fnr family transcriptional regulator n=1 Tax=Puia sp. TaxID=2045100 RepID=UPI002B83FAB0|nr:Crp/Fnr family transcriptional regulator [Puia sp.]HVU96685.1 Crp/Fnr family transcriptional regulator [Puia sp.]
MKKKTSSCDLKSCFLCQRCLPEWIPAAEVHRKNFTYKKGEMIFQEGDVVKGIFFVYSGAVKVHKKWGSEKELIIRFARAGSLFGHRGLGKDHHYPISATALEPLEVCYFDLEFFQASLKVNPGLNQGLLQFFADELQAGERKMRDIAHMQVKGRVAQALLQLREDFGLTPDGAIGLTLSRQDLASLVGATYETVFRIINELAQEGLIRLEGKQIAIADAAGLIDYTKE